MSQDSAKNREADLSSNDYLLWAIQKITTLGCGTDDQRHSELMRTVVILDDLRDDLKKHGFIFCHTAVYLRLVTR